MHDVGSDRGVSQARSGPSQDEPGQYVGLQSCQIIRCHGRTRYPQVSYNGPDPTQAPSASPSQQDRRARR